MANDIEGLWKLVQTGARTSVLKVSAVDQQTGVFSVKATQEGLDVNGDGNGHRDGDFVTFTIHWNTGHIGAYHGVFDKDMGLMGAAFDVKNPGEIASWHLDRVFL